LFLQRRNKGLFIQGEKVNPKNWMLKISSFTSGKNKSKFAESIKMQLNHSDLMQETKITKNK
jgi:hypothetical protein